MDVTSSKFEAIDTVFAVKGKDHRGRAVTLDPSPSNLMEAYWPLTLIEEISVNSNCYIAERRRSNPDLVYWNKPSISRDITVSCIYQFLAIIYYFGIVRLPSKRDYWSVDEYMPKHKVVNALGMNRERFAFIWRHVKITKLAVGDEEKDEASESNDNDVDDVDDDRLIEVNIERVVRDQEEEATFEDESKEEISEDDKQKSVWLKM